MHTGTCTYMYMYMYVHVHVVEAMHVIFHTFFSYIHDRTVTCSVHKL